MAASRKNVPILIQLIVGAVLVIAWTMRACIMIACAILTACASLIEPRRRRKVKHGPR